MSNKRKFILKPEHLLLLKNMYVGWQDCEFGAPEIDPKRPYGNSDVESDIAEILGLQLFEDAEGEKHLSAEQSQYIYDLHRDTKTALQIILRNCEIKCGEYETDKYDYSGTDFKLVNQPAKESLITNYTSALQAIYDHVGFVEDWVICPIDDRATEFYWYIDDEGVHYADSLEELESGEGNSYSDEIYTQHFYKKHIYEGADYTMIFCDPHTDGMKWFRVFDNLKRINRNE